MNHSSDHISLKYHNANTNNRFSFLPFLLNKSRNRLPDPVNPFLSDPKITMADVKSIWVLPPAAGDHAHVGNDIRDLEGTNVSLPVEPRLFYTDVSEFSRCRREGSTDYHRDRK